MNDSQLERLASLAAEIISESDFEILADLFAAEKRKLAKEPIQETDLKAMYDAICSDYIEKFCTKQDMYFEDCVMEELDGILTISGEFFSFADVKTDIDLQAPKGLIIQYSDYCKELFAKHPFGPAMNYSNFIKHPELCQD